MKPNKDSYENIISFCDEHKIQYLGTTNVFPKHGHHKVAESLRLTYEENGDILKRIDQYRGFHTPKVITPNSYVCNSIKHSLYIDSSGCVYPCNMLPVELGNINQRTISEIWYTSEKLSKIAQLKWLDLKICNSCESKSFCSRCAGIALICSGDLCFPDPIECDNAHYRNSEYASVI
ncbi:MAG: SPASM domain-containing protein [Clostridium sp.]|jgi:radical SAM protein with 4Fe4S-binding SPASM domain|nr:SPASM domain-containing protein [Clostridium sp.]